MLFDTEWYNMDSTWYIMEIKCNLIELRYSPYTYVNKWVRTTHHRPTSASSLVMDHREWVSAFCEEWTCAHSNVNKTIDQLFDTEWYNMDSTWYIMEIKCNLIELRYSPYTYVNKWVRTTHHRPTSASSRVMDHREWVSAFCEEWTCAHSNVNKTRCAS